MKIKEGFVTRDVAGEQIMVATGAAKFSGLVRSNASAAFIINSLKQDVTKEDIVASMMEKYDAPKEVLEADVEKVLSALRSIGAIDE